MNNKVQKGSDSSWKGCIIFGGINILLVLFCTMLRRVLLSFGMILLIIVGFIVSVNLIKENWKEGLRTSVIGCSIGLILHCFAAYLYATNIWTALVNTFLKIVR